MPERLANLIADRFTAHHVDLLRVEAQERATIFRMLKDLEAELAGQMQRRLPFETATPSVRQRRLEALFTATQKTIQTAYRQIDRHHAGERAELAELEGVATRELVNGVLNIPLLHTGVPLTTLRALAKADIQGAPATEWWSRQAGGLQSRFKDVIRRGVFAGETMGELLRRVRGTREGGFRDGLMEVPRHQAEALIRTSVQSVANAARQATLTANQDVLKGYQLLVTLDTRTSEICRARSGYAWDFEGNPLNARTKERFPGPPPYHFACRSTLIPILKAWSELVSAPEVAVKLRTAAARLPKGTQASMDGQVAEDLTYEEWLKQQPDDRQIAVLGRGKWELWRRGQIGLADLIDQNGRPLALTELRRLVGMGATSTGVAPGGGPLPPATTQLAPSGQVGPETNTFPAQQALAEQEVVGIDRKRGGGVNETKFVRFADGSRGVFKPRDGEDQGLRAGIREYYTREAVASDVAHLVGYTDLVPTTAIRQVRGSLGSIQEFREGLRAYESKDRFGVVVSDRQRALLFDAVIGNTDRHMGNWLVTADGKIVLIDHGLSLATENQTLRLGFLLSFSPRELRRAIPERLKRPWRTAWPQIEQAMQRRGIEPSAITLAKRRLDRLLARGTTWEDLEKPL